MSVPAESVTALPLPENWLDGEALSAIDTTDPATLDLALMAPMQKQLEDMQELGDALPAPLFDLARTLESTLGVLIREQQRRLDDLAAENEADLPKYIKAKQPIEDRWIDDLRQFNGKDRILESKLYPSDAADPKRGDSGPITVHATRSRTLMCWARLGDVMLPANDLPFRVDPPDDPDPEDYAESLAKAAQEAAAAQPPAQPGQPPAPPPQPDEAMLHSVAERAAADMQERVFAMAHKAGFKKIMQRALLDTARIGCGLIKGPHPEIERKRRSRGGDFEIIETPRAGLSYVDPWYFYYDMTPTLARSSVTFEVQLLSRRELSDMKAYPRVVGPVIDELLDEKNEHKGVRGALRESIEKRNQYLDVREPVDDVWVVLETHRVMEPEKFEKATGTVWEHDDPPLVHMWSCGGKCFKWKVTPLERDYRVDYYSTTIMPADDTIFGYGYPYLGRGAQRWIKGAADATLANAGASVAPMFLVAQGKVHPNRENWRAAGFNVWSVENQDQPMENFFASVKVDSNVEQNLKLLEVGNQLMDQDTLFNQIQQGNFNGEEMPASGVVIAANIGSVFQKAIAADADDNCFAPLCERLIWWDSMYSDSPIEGQFKASGIAATQLVSKDLALQHTMVAISLAEKPQFAGFQDNYDLLQSFLHNIDGLPNGGSLFDKSKALQNQAAMQQAAQKGDPAKAAEIASREKIALADIEARQQLAAAQQQLDREKLANDRYIEQLKFKTALVQAQQDSQIDMVKVEADMKKAAMADNTERFTKVLDVRARVGQQKVAEQTKGDPHSKFD
jgi:hypothetical protein